LKKILIYRNSSLGDFINASPAIKLIKELNPDSKIYFASQKKNTVGFVTPNLIPIKKKFIDQFLFYEYNFLSILFFLIKIFKIKFDKLYYLNEYKFKSKEKRDFLLFKLFRIKKMYGFDKGNFDYSKFNETFYLCKIVKNDISKKEISYSGIFKKNRFIKKKYITISLGGRNIRKSWNLKYWEFLVNKITKRFPNLNIKIVGSTNELYNANIICKINKNKITSICGKTSINLLFKVINSSSYHISHDDGTMHVASIFNKPGTAIFGITSKKGKWYPMNPKLRIFYPNKNINEIKPNFVFNKIIYDLKNLR
jgi:ADP-heptose:LPS heptosyltransferase|tara:strand:- start:583 stop:1512 length:930 start_codon:yes stop_codon:yes gene_type:complete